MTEISVYVLKPFPFSRNGITEEFAEAGKTLPIPERLFNGLNKDGYVRRESIGDGHFSLKPAQAPAEPEVAPVAVSEPLATAPATTKAPQPPVKTADLSGDEAAAIADGSWKALKFFAKRSIAAKVSDQPITDGALADAAIEAYIAAQKI